MRARIVPAVLALVGLVPLAPIVIRAVAGLWRFPALWPDHFTVRGLTHLASPGVFAAIVTSAIIAAGVAVVATGIGLAAGRALGDHRFAGRRLVLLCLMLPILVPPLTATLGIDLTFIRLGLADTRLGVGLVHLVPTVPYTTLILTDAFASATGRDRETVARTLGAGPWAAFAHVRLPALRPALAVALLLAFLISWSQYVLTLIIGGGSVVTLSMLLFSAAAGSDPVITSALALVFLIPLLPLLGLGWWMLGRSRS